MGIDEDCDDVNYTLSPTGTGICNVGGSGDEGGRDELLLKLQQYVASDASFTRQRIGRLLVEVFRTAANNGTKLNVNEVMQVVRQIADDTDAQVGLDLMEHIPHVVTICHETPHLFDNIFHNHLLDIIIRYLQDQDNQVRMMAQTAVLTLTKKGLIDNTTIEGKLCPVIETLCTSVDFLNSGISLMCKMAPLIGKELTEKIFLDRYITLCEDKEFYTRKFCASHLGELCAAVGRKTLFRKLFPIFVDLCSDKVWGVRKACVDVMMPVSCCMTLQHRRLLLAELLATHLNDESKWVRMSAFQILGPFISTFAKQFTEVTYNQHGELVFTSQQDNRFSIRYSYEGIFPTKCAIRSHTLDMEDHNSKDNFNSSVIIQKPIFEDDEDESQEDDISTMRAYKSKIQRKHLKNDQTLDDTENFNSFLYYYIEPDLPLDDELVEAAKRSAAQNNVERKPLISTTASSKASSLDAALKEDKYAADDIKNFNDQEIVPQHLIDSFLSMAEPEQCSGDMSPGDIPHHCAFSFPAVVLTLGKENWPYLKQAYQSLASANQWKVRRTLASSIHEIAIILGEELTIADLVPIYDGFIKDLDEVRVGILKHLATFLKILKPTVRLQYLPRLKEFLTTDNEWNWRFREELATQLLDIVNLFDPTDVDRFIVPLALDLLRDKYAAVRYVALSLMTQIVAHLSDNRRLVKALFRKLKSLVYARKWVRRQTFAFVCANLISKNAISGDRFSQEMLPTLLEISSDKVPNVRLVVARTLSKNVIPMGSEWLGVKQAEEVENRLREMRSDPDRDVRVLAGGEENAALDILSQTKTEQSRNIMF
ncbi:serine/threonine-protein phosphatase 4 regulatory subunit 1-like isoform X2 [Bombus pyrosoma]|uniref:serine/threonine-protein phosphatase 4 regulatory subunit 1-like isoform X2 n=1 Tax=Bombus pyrosoma TaxID=396416 RepID=UPI001CB942D4|nr:serine/threonine-protein phosphatase 4 regulatory subunit 1-like isoform X2 [Bombus pyrosoma]XP_043586720.1 serine/threonine-protein phosphatase 4 regulatory subunit 1-like isoform X2 [Bombus pyrosoma]